jgi:hypothetical protein
MTLNCDGSWQDRTEGRRQTHELLGLRSPLSKLSQPTYNDPATFAPQQRQRQNEDSCRFMSCAGSFGHVSLW